jgi:hypothetical protein
MSQTTDTSELEIIIDCDRTQVFYDRDKNRYTLRCMSSLTYANPIVIDFILIQISFSDIIFSKVSPWPTQEEHFNEI